MTGMTLHSQWLPTVLTLLFCGTGLAGQPTEPGTGGLALLADARDEGIYLRWAFDDGAALEAIKNGGVTLTRTSSGGATTTLLTDRQPLPYLAWASQSDTSQFAGVISELLYRTSPITDPELNAQQQEQATGMLLFAADQDFAAANSAALGYFDGTTSAGEVYTYTLSLPGLGPDNQTSLTVAADQRTRRVPPLEVTTDFANRDQTAARISWLREATDTVYTSYYVSRREQGTTDWRWLHEDPLLQIQTEDTYDPRQYFVDSTVLREIAYEYRVTGVTPFGTYGPPSPPATLAAVFDPLFDPVRISDMTKMTEEQYIIRWSEVIAAPGQAVSHRVQISDDPFANYRDATDELPATTKEAVIQNPKDGQYVRILTTDRQGTAITSFPKIIRVFDEVPPAPPVGLAGTLDSTGLVVLTWAPNQEEDLRGYRVYLGTHAEGYFPQITEDVWPDTVYTYRVTMETADEEVYFRLKGIDFTGNYSEFSQTLQLKRPDLLPPTAPVIRAYQSSTAGVELDVAFSTVNDLAYHLLERQEDGVWSVLDTLRGVGAESMLMDTSGVPGRRYDYRVTAVDDAELSASSELLTASRTDDKRRAPVTAFAVELPVDLGFPIVSWRYPPGQNLRGFQLYRAVGDGRLAAYKYLTASSPELRFRAGTFAFRDNEATAGSFTYQLMALHQDGGYSDLTPAITVTHNR